MRSGQVKGLSAWGRCLQGEWSYRETNEAFGSSDGPKKKGLWILGRIKYILSSIKGNKKSSLVEYFGTESKKHRKKNK